MEKKKLWELGQKMVKKSIKIAQRSRDKEVENITK